MPSRVGMKLLGTNPLGAGPGFAPGAGLCALAERHAGTGWR